MRSPLPKTKLKSLFNYQNDDCTETWLFLKVLYQSKCEGGKVEQGKAKLHILVLFPCQH